MEILPDPWILFLQIIPFTLTLWMLHTVLYKPMVAYLEDRDQAIYGSRRDAQSLQTKANEKLEEYELALATARKEAGSARTEARRGALVAREEKIAAARTAADTQINEAASVISGEKELAAKELERMASSLAQDIAQSVLHTNTSEARA
jgi:F-type H+-transporting ATPase subunit b